MIAMLFQRNGHLPVGPGPADPGWGQTQAWGLDGADPSLSIYDRLLGRGSTNVSRRIRGGTLTVHEPLPLDAPTISRHARIAAQQSSLPAARFFQSYTGAGTGRSWSGGMAAVTPHALAKNFNPNMAGAAELHPATTYDPFPSPADLYPKVV